MSGPPDAGGEPGEDLGRYWGEALPTEPPPIAADGGALARLAEPAWWAGSQPLRPALDAVYAEVRRQASAALAALAAAPDSLPEAAPKPRPKPPEPVAVQPRVIALPGFEDAVRGQAPRRAGWRWR